MSQCGQQVWGRAQRSIFPPLPRDLAMMDLINTAAHKALHINSVFLYYPMTPFFYSLGCF